MATEEPTARQLLSQLKVISATLRNATRFTDQMCSKSWTLLHAFKAHENMSFARVRAIALNKQLEEQLEYSRLLLQRSHDLSHRLGLSHHHHVPPEDHRRSSERRRDLGDLCNRKLLAAAFEYFSLAYRDGLDQFRSLAVLLSAPSARCS